MMTQVRSLGLRGVEGYPVESVKQLVAHLKGEEPIPAAIAFLPLV